MAYKDQQKRRAKVRVLTAQWRARKRKAAINAGQIIRLPGRPAKANRTVRIQDCISLDSPDVHAIHLPADPWGEKDFHDVAPEDLGPETLEAALHDRAA